MPHVQSPRNVGGRHDYAVGFLVGVRVGVENTTTLPLSVPSALDGPMVVRFRNLLAHGERDTFCLFAHAERVWKSHFPASPLPGAKRPKRSLLRRKSTSGSRLRATAEHHP